MIDVSDHLNKYTIIVNSCDDYEDLWFPFFKLFKKYWDPENVKILLNTESKNYSFEGLDITCVHAKRKNETYAQRFLNVLKYVETPYVLIMLDDFFIREKVDQDQICNIIEWMENDKTIAYFNCDSTPLYKKCEESQYKGFIMIPKGNEYTLNLQVAIWRKDLLKSFWKNKASPWEWELYVNLIAASSEKYHFYCSSKEGNGFIDYGYNPQGMGVFRGKWVKNDVVPLFEKEKINVDFSKRGFFNGDNSLDKTLKNYDNRMGRRNSIKKYFYNQFDIIHRCLPKYFLSYVFYVLKQVMQNTKEYSVDDFVNEKLKEQRL